MPLAAEPPSPGNELPRRQTVFFVRHAESRWNRAQADYALMSMMWENDHGLTEDGRRQAEELRRRLGSARDLLASGAEGRVGGEAEAKWVHQLLNPDKVYSSPFTRAVSTASLALRDLVREDRPLVLLKEARESKNIGGADSTGVAVGQEIRDRVEDELRMLYEEDGETVQNEAVEEFRRMALDVSDVEEPWWGGYLGDSEDHLHERIDALMSRLRQTRGSLPGGGGVSVLVGHSLFFRSLFARHLGGAAEAEDLQWVEDSLQMYVLPFCGIVGATFEWDEVGNSRILEARPLLGTQLQVAKPIVTPPAIVASELQAREGGSLQKLVPLYCACGRQGETCLSQ
eukprot:CAMPEP_0176110114 /NCGR_PEP_ID=MMETSP0120_2-20121206/55291_1 /TAXON_ID=160619 /ORGANISM="Kryptoperidinium foliaceum, Strain CCMP 1326" /LENGTH=342 /DNA_ID=CAMNT_0017444315 /DNA_START=68 /DNA_END=1096 /DNA_ORIENTATION=+